MNQCYITQTSNLNTCDKKTRDRLDLYTPVSLTNVNLKGTVKKLKGTFLYRKIYRKKSAIL